MKRDIRHRQRGFTMFETLVAASVGATVTLMVLHVVLSANELSEADRAHLRVSAMHRRSLEAVANVLRAAAPPSLSGFDAQDVSTRPRFQRVTGYGDSAATLSGAEVLEWSPSPAVDGVAHPGSLYYVDGGGTRHLVAPNVPKGGFEVRREGRNLAVRLTTYHGANAASLVSLTGETVVSMRNAP